MEALWTRFQPLSSEVKKIAEEGTLGLPVMLHADLSVNYDISREFVFGTNLGFLETDYAIDIPLTHRILDPYLGGGALLDL
jgi:hypothetical protein